MWPRLLHGVLLGMVGCGGAEPVDVDRSGVTLATRRAADVQVRVVQVSPGQTAVFVVDAVGERRVLADHPAADRITLDPTGRWLGFVSDLDGWAAIWVAPIDGGPARALTNQGLVRVPGSAPVGFVPVPVGDDLTFDGDRLRWTVDGAAHAVAWR